MKFLAKVWQSPQNQFYPDVFARQSSDMKELLTGAALPDANILNYFIK